MLMKVENRECSQKYMTSQNEFHARQKSSERNKTIITACLLHTFMLNTVSVL